MSEMILTPEARREQTRRALLASAEELFLAHGYHHVTLDGVADRAGFSKGAIYSNFDSKADLFFAVLEERARESLERYSATALGESDLESVIHAVAAVTGPLRPDWQQSLLDVEARALAARDPEARQRLAELQRRQVSRVAELLETLAAQLGLELAHPAEQTAIIAVSAATGLADMSRVDPDSDHDQWFEAVIEMLARWGMVS